MGNVTFQVITKTNCCNKIEDEHNEDINEKENENQNDNEKLIVERINSFSTDINKTADYQYYLLFQINNMSLIAS